MSYGFCGKFHVLSAVQKLGKSVKIWQSYWQFKGGNFFLRHSVVNRTVCPWTSIAWHCIVIFAFFAGVMHPLHVVCKHFLGFWENNFCPFCEKRNEAITWIRSGKFVNTWTQHGKTHLIMFRYNCVWLTDTASGLLSQLEMWANAQRDGRPAECRWRPLFNGAKFGWRQLLGTVQ